MGQYGIHRVEKIKGGSGIGGIQQEQDREKEYPGSDIDHERTKDNVVLMDTTEGKRWQHYVAEQISKTGCRVRKDSVRAITAIYTASPEYMMSLSKEQQMDFFRDCLAWHERTYGKPFYAIVHMDEKTPHMHVSGIPFQEREGGKVVLSAKTCLGGRQALAQKQEDFYKSVCEPRGLDHHHVREPHQQREHLSCLEYKISQEEQRLLDQIEKLLPEPEPGQDMIAAKERLLSRLFGRDEVIVSRQELDKLQLQAEQVPRLARSRQEALEEMQAIRKQADSIYKAAAEVGEVRLHELQEQIAAAEKELEALEDQRLDPSEMKRMRLIYDILSKGSLSVDRMDRLGRVSAIMKAAVAEMEQELPQREREKLQHNTHGKRRGGPSR